MNVLYCTDLSEPSAITAQVVAFADHLGAQLYVLHVIPPSIGQNPAATPMPADPSAGVAGFTPYGLVDPEEQRAQLEGRAEAFDRFINTRFSSPVRAALRQGVPHEVIINDAREHDSSYIAMIKHRRGRLERLLLGSVTSNVLKETTRPVVIFPNASGTAESQQKEKAAG